MHEYNVRQLIESEVNAANRQKEYEILMKTAPSVVQVVPQAVDNSELAKTKKSEAIWMKECHNLIRQLDVEVINIIHIYLNYTF